MTEGNAYNFALILQSIANSFIGAHHAKPADNLWRDTALRDLQSFLRMLGYRMVPIEHPATPAADSDAEMGRLWQMGYRAGLYAAASAQPTTAIDPNENTYQKGRFDGVMEFGKAIHALRAATEAAADLTGDVTIRGDA